MSYNGINGGEVVRYYSNNNNSNNNNGDQQVQGNGVSYTLLSVEEESKVKERLQAISKLIELEQDEGQKRAYRLHYKAEVAKELESNLAKAILNEQSAKAKFDDFLDRHAQLEIEKHRQELANQQLQERIDGEAKKRAEVEDELNALTPLLFKLNKTNQQATAELDQTKSSLESEGQKRKVAEAELIQTRSSLEKKVKKIKVVEEELTQTRSLLENEGTSRQNFENELRAAISSLDSQKIARKVAEAKLVEAIAQIEEDKKRIDTLEKEKKKIVSQHEETQSQLKQTKAALCKSQKALEDERAMRAELEQKIQKFINQFQFKK